ncbi:MAG: hypothetical protein ABSA96_09140 [Candidatus Acidiferrales bacterium]
MVVLFFLGISITLLAPLLRRYRMASPSLAVGAFIALAVATAGLVNADPRIGEAAIESNRKQYIFIIACEVSVLLLGLFSWKDFKWAFWRGWGINAAFSLFTFVVIVWLEFFWHW